MKIFVAIFLCTISLLNACQENLSQVAKFRDGSAIIFPENDEQPPTSEAVIWSCANSTEKSVTDWYMSEFGFDCNSKEVHGIIEADLMFISNRKLREKFQSDLYENFRRIAATSIGRILLYRLLIEIEKSGNNETGHIHVRPSSKNSFCTKGIIEFCPSNDKYLSNAIGQTRGNIVPIVLESRTDDIGLFHELLHWYHYLNDFERFITETNIECGISGANISMGYENKNLWTDNNSELPIINMEEFRTEMGYMVPIFKNAGNLLYSQQKFSQGDDLGENLYRICRGQIIRYGHKESGSVPINAIIRAWTIYATNILPYKTGLLTN